MHIFFINPIGRNISLQIIDTEKRTVIESKEIEKTGNDFEIIPQMFVDITKRYSPTEIWCITWPGPFTLMRIITLILNSIAYNSPDISLKSCHYFDLITTEIFKISQKQEIPQVILEANRHEYLIREMNWGDTLIKKEEISPGIYTGYIDESIIPWYTPYTPDTEAILEYFWWKMTDNRLSPLYIKAPNITIWSKKTTPQFS
jgi:tRNA A37 threonylcarbamoyladenosine modification protein TsaB